jgi:hypothetical protein
LLCRHHGCELEIPLYPPYRFFTIDYCVFDCGGMAFSETNLKPFVHVCSSLPGEPHAYSALWRFRSHCWRLVGHTEVGLQLQGLLQTIRATCPTGAGRVRAWFGAVVEGLKNLSLLTPPSVMD